VTGAAAEGPQPPTGVKHRSSSIERLLSFGSTGRCRPFSDTHCPEQIAAKLSFNGESRVSERDGAVSPPAQPTAA
jgi:hypothetical protein